MKQNKRRIKRKRGTLPPVTMTGGTPKRVAPESVTKKDALMFKDKTKDLFLKYLAAVELEENPRLGAEMGYTPTELGALRRVAHNKLMRHLEEHEGIDCSDRAKITELARKYGKWIRE